MWAQEIKRLPHLFCAVQTCRYILRPDLEIEGGLTHTEVGLFTLAFVQHNTGQEVSVDWSGKQRRLRSIYTTSRCWSDFTFHMPTREDYRQYWDANFPKFTRPVLRALNIPGVGSLFCCCTCFGRWLKRLQMAWLPPRELDTGHGFKLLKT